MEVKSNVRQRRMDRMKQIIASEQIEYRNESGRADNVSGRLHGQAQTSYGRPPGSPAAGSGYAERGIREEEPMRTDYGREDPEYVWKRQERERWTSLERAVGPSPDDWTNRGGLKPPTVRQIWIKLGISAVLFGGIWGMFRIDHPLADRGRQWVSSALTEDYDFSAAAAWYEREFGGLPAFLPALRAKSDPEAQKASSPSVQRLYTPVHGKIVGTAADGELGVTLRTEPEASVAALDTGRVVSVSTGTDKATVVVIQHAGGLQSTYGWLQGTTLKTHDWVKGGETIGSVTTDAAGGAGKLYVAVKKENQYVNPAEVVSFD
jgi:stage IV sporulation protein FA